MLYETLIPDTAGRPMLLAAYNLAYKAHITQKRRYTGEPYFNHCIRVANKLFQWGVASEEEIAAALCHDVLEDTAVTMNELAYATSADVALLVKHLTTPKKIPFQFKDAHAESLYRLSVAPRSAQIIKCADINDNCRDITRHAKPEKALDYLLKKSEQLDAMARNTMARNIGSTKALLDTHDWVLKELAYLKRLEGQVAAELAENAAKVEQEINDALFFEITQKLRENAIF